MRSSTLLVLLAAALPLAACATTAGVAGRALGDAEWRLVELGGRAAVAGEGPAGGAHLRFAADSGRVTGSTGCNRLAGPYTLDGDRLRFGTLVSTRMACVDPARQRQEGDFMRALEATRRHAVAGDTLALLGDDADAAPLARLVAR